MPRHLQGTFHCFNCNYKNNFTIKFIHVNLKPLKLNRFSLKQNKLSIFFFFSRFVQTSTEDRNEALFFYWETQFFFLHTYEARIFKVAAW